MSSVSIEYACYATHVMVCWVTWVTWVTWVDWVDWISSSGLRVAGFWFLVSGSWTWIRIRRFRASSDDIADDKNTVLTIQLALVYTLVKLCT
jgi:hypothetical protein